MKPAKHARGEAAVPADGSVDKRGHPQWCYNDPVLGQTLVSDDPPSLPPVPFEGAATGSWTDPTGTTCTYQDLPPLDPKPYAAMRERRDGWTAARQRLFIETLAATGSVARAAEATGLSPRSAYRLRAHPNGAAFARAMHAAQLTAANRLLGVAFERATTGMSQQVWRQGKLVTETTPPSDRLLMWLLRHLSPELFGRQGDPAQRLARIQAAQADLPVALAALTDTDPNADAEDAGGRYPAMPVLERG